MAYSKSTMRLLVTLAVILDVILVGITIAFFAMGSPGAPQMALATALLILVPLIIVPLARRRGRL
ncbi:hypothetical protein [Catenuloplanes indicus]|uniref:Xanthosine utilization system XapX-like protein n=1 Tax=Catenuloplanes indicus TaxID=137267 RepID=A0AAE3W9I9_9ACTN|nr:hypothetical protein [Catenuloplanes indicus]MDQ0370960.1 xanthosine utilization system XapX-like protein [Catenuloplanes indicus]